MSYQVLARKWRPRNFEQMVGQTHVLRGLINALDQDRLHHAYLFTGTRGVGKTTLARILAKCLNCETGVSAKPCGECSACQEIDEGRFIDLIEVDAASRTKVEDTRELLDNVQYAPTRGRYKVYLVDEVHMLSGHSFNALLKTLEEPPPHVKFLLATTDPQKLPITILSRCLQFNLKRMSLQMIAGHLQEILQKEQIPAEESALAELARAADGSMRDALSLLDQAIAFGDGEVRATEVGDMLGSVPREHLYALLSSLVSADAAGVMQSVARLAEQAVDFEGVLADIISLLHRVALAQTMPQTADSSNEDPNLIKQLAGQLTPEAVQLYYQVALIGRRDLPLAPDTKSGFEMVLLRMLSFQVLEQPSQKPVPVSGGAASVGQQAGRRDVEKQQPQVSVQNTAAKDVDTVPAIVDECAAVNISATDWPQLVKNLDLKGVALALANNCSFRSYEEGVLSLVLDKQHEQMRTRNAEQKLEKAFSEYTGASVSLRMEIATHQAETPYQVADRTQDERQRAAEQAIESDDMVQALKDSFGAKIVPGSIKPI